MEKRLMAIGVVIGAGAMYFLDPRSGRGRRAVVRDKAFGAVNDASKTIGRRVRDLGNRAEGLLAETGSLLKVDRAGDDVLVARVRSKLGRAVRHPHGVEVTASEGHVLLGGSLPEADIQRAVRSARAVRGVVDVDNRLEARRETDTLDGERGRAN
jgi:osmotically-inducible protein OsmY